MQSFHMGTDRQNSTGVKETLLFSVEFSLNCFV